MAKLAVIVDGGFLRATLYIEKDPENPDKPYGYPDANTIYQKISRDNESGEKDVKPISPDL